VRVVVIGAGVVGVTTAYELARDGHEVVVIERDEAPGRATSWGNAGLIAPGHSYTWASPKAPAMLVKSLVSKDQALKFTPRLELELYRWSLRFLRNCTAERARTNTLRKLALCTYSQGRLHDVTAETGVTYDRISKGLLYCYRDRESFDAGVAHMGILQEAGRTMEVLDTDAVIALEPALAGARSLIAGAILCPADESGDCSAFTAGVAEQLATRGVEFRYSTTAHAIVESGGRVQHVETSRGPVAGDAYVLCAGPWAAKLARGVGLKLPVYPIKGYSVTVPVIDGSAAPDVGGVDENKLVAWARFGDRIRLTSTAEFAGYDTTHEPSDFTVMLDAAKLLFGGACDWSQPTYWAGLRPMTPEGTPIIGAARQPNMWLNVGHGHMGWTMSCGSARLFADMFAGRATDIDVTGLTLASR
jgi:D-amino-acid dehydrogenase